MDIVNSAMQIEVDEENFYLDSARKSENKVFKRIFKTLAEDEKKHYGVVQKMKNTLSVTFDQTRVLKIAKNIFAEARQNKEQINVQNNLKDLLQKALESEKKSEEFYLQRAGETLKDAQKELFQKLAKEEKTHRHLIEKLMEFLTRPLSWIENSEFNQLDSPGMQQK